MAAYEVLVEVHEVTEWRDGCVYTTEKVGKGWIEMDRRGTTITTTKGTFIMGSISTGDPEGLTIPRRADRDWLNRKACLRCGGSGDLTRGHDPECVHFNPNLTVYPLVSDLIH